MEKENSLSFVESLQASAVAKNVLFLLMEDRDPFPSGEEECYRALRHKSVFLYCCGKKSKCLYLLAVHV